ncbi:carboxypeptidase regulatory-like domain-containing protein [candidate division KSB1 bacterium]|nr:carboxypeptidase regulatory-like domain-containing protein [candidate division KSB1 bacterium]
MKKLLYLIIIVFLTSLLECVSTNNTVVLQKPEPGKSLVVGAVLVENDGIDDLYQSKTSNIVVVVVGKSILNGNEEIKGYRTKTDKNGYFLLQNIPPGSYVLKGIEVDVGYTNHYLISSLWEGNQQRYIYEDKMIDYNVRSWPEEENSTVINLGINYFKLDNAGRIYDNRFKSLNNTVLGIKEKYHTMAAPDVYFKEQYPEIEWFD